MKCQFCDNPATVHVNKYVKASKKMRELHLCEGCARKHNLIPDQPTPHVDLKALLGLLIGPSQAGPGTVADTAALTCPACGLKYGEFRAEGRLGCPGDYDAFKAALEPLLERIHRSQTHAGKAPRTARRAADLADLRRRLAAAVAVEKYEDAARLRDLIRQKEASDEPR
ncbi:MAG: UvrB/uvrC motif protein [Gemmataceae bacterium]|nr:UvrB/uvrC motif protein [Gemmataceae bacterium]